MKSLFVAVSLLFVLTLSLYAAESAKITAEKTKIGVEYQIALAPHFQMNLDAPFKFYLLDAKGKTIKKVALSEFTQKNERLYLYHSDGKEVSVKWWFVACIHEGGKITLCKTMSGKKAVK